MKHPASGPDLQLQQIWPASIYMSQGVLWSDLQWGIERETSQDDYTLLPVS